MLLRVRFPLDISARVCRDAVVRFRGSFKEYKLISSVTNGVHFGSWPLGGLSLSRRRPLRRPSWLPGKGRRRLPGAAVRGRALPDRRPTNRWGRLSWCALPKNREKGQLVHE